MYPYASRDWLQPLGKPCTDNIVLILTAVLCILCFINQLEKTTLNLEVYGLMRQNERNEREAVIDELFSRMTRQRSATTFLP